MKEEKRDVNKKSISIELDPKPIFAFVGGVAVGATGMALVKTDDPEVIATAAIKSTAAIAAAYCGYKMLANGGNNYYSYRTISRAFDKI